MNRPRLQILMLGLALILGLLVHTAPAQGPDGEPGGPGGRGGRGLGGPGGPGGPGGFGGRGPYSDPVSLINAKPVQEDLKLTDKQKTQVADFAKTLDQQRRQVFEKLRNRPAMPAADAAMDEDGNPIANTGTNLGNGQDAAAGNGQGGNGQDGNGQGSNGQGGNGQGGNGQGGNGGRRGRGNIDREAMQAAMSEFQQTSLQSLAKLLDKTQRTRLDQISLQVQGVMAVAREDIATKLNMSEEQIASVQEIVSQRDDGRREIFRAQFANFSRRGGRGGNNPPGNTDGTGANGATGGANRNNGGTGGDRNGGPGGGNGGPGGGNGGPGGGAGRPNFDDPAVRAQFEAVREKMTSLDDTAKKAVGKILRKNQKAAFNKMLGKPFDVASLQPPRPGAQAADSPAETTGDSKTTTQPKSTKDASPSTARPARGART